MADDAPAPVKPKRQRRKRTRRRKRWYETRIAELCVIFIGFAFVEFYFAKKIDTDEFQKIGGSGVVIGAIGAYLKARKLL